MELEGQRVGHREAEAEAAIGYRDQLAIHQLHARDRDAELRDRGGGRDRAPDVGKGADRRAHGPRMPNKRSVAPAMTPSVPSERSNRCVRS